MIFEEFKKKSFDGLNLYFKCWKPVSEPVGVIVFVHGLGEHINRYSHWARHFNEQGWAFIGYDLRGHGHSSGRRGNGQYTAHLQDIDLLFKKTKDLFGARPKILYGHSMGGNLALGYAISRKPKIDKLIITSPWLGLVNPPSKAIKYLAQTILKIYPSLITSNGLNPKHLSTDSGVGEAYKKDHRCHGKISASLFFQMEEWAEFIIKNKHKINVPLLLMHGKEDKITSAKVTSNFAENTSENTHLKLWDHCFHELHNEFCKEEVFNYISSWILSIPSRNIRPHADGTI